VVLVGLLAAACGGTADGSPTGAPLRTSNAGPGATAVNGSGASDAPTADETATDDPTEPTEPTASPATDAPSSTPGSGPAAACAGNDENRDFYVSVAGSVEWAVYCPVLGSGWFVEAGQYRLAGGGWMEIAYRGPGGAHIALHQGTPCSTDGCAPGGQDAGEAAFGDLTGTLLIDGDQLAIVVDEGSTPSWTIRSTGLDQAEFESIAGALVQVGG
jgi:hypothetical protein